ncbi:MAG: tetratricopeptide repeat-containing sensor histidine kinase, partial [Candidatus Cloacimonetes bacterium]|nr:tetratricopeptide repeat-containing sensor histidine kinase [Candidatus Cloacimonadota bacterium]
IIFIASSILLSQTKIDSLESELKKAPEKKKAEILNQLAQENWYISPKKTIEYGTRALELARKYKDKEQEANALIFTGNGYLLSGDYDIALEEYFKKGLSLSEKIKYEKGISGCLNSIAVLYINKGDSKKALETFLRSLEIVKKRGDKIELAKIQLNIASLYASLGDYEKGLDHYFKSLAFFEEMGDEESYYKTLNNIAAVYHSWNNYDKALGYFLRILEYFEKKEYEFRCITPLYNIGKLYMAIGNYELALDHYLKGLKISEEFGSKKDIGQAIQGAGEAFMALGNYDMAKDYILNSLDYFKEIGDKDGIAVTYINLGKINILTGNNNKAIEYLTNSLILVKELNNKEDLKYNYELFSRAYAALKEYKKALVYYKLFAAIKDSIFNEETSKKFMELDIKYETTKKEKEISNLKIQNKIQRMYVTFLISGLVFILILAFVIYRGYRLKIKANKQLADANKQILNQKEELERVNTELEELNATKNKFFSIIAHDMKNAFTSFRAGSSLLSEDIQNYDKDMVRILASELRISSEKLFNLLHNLLKWARVQTGRMEYKPEELNLKHIIDNNIALMEGMASQKNI